MKPTLKLKIVSGVVTLSGIAALTAQADPDTYQGRRVRGVETQNGGAVTTRRGGTAVKTENGTAVQTRNGNVYADMETMDRGSHAEPNRSRRTQRNSRPHLNGVYTKPK